MTNIQDDISPEIKESARRKAERIRLPENLEEEMMKLEIDGKPLFVTTDDEERTKSALAMRIQRFYKKHGKDCKFVLESGVMFSKPGIWIFKFNDKKSEIL